jgi:hypothetical protein
MRTIGGYIDEHDPGDRAIKALETAGHECLLSRRGGWKSEESGRLQAILAAPQKAMPSVCRTVISPKG